MYLKSLISIFVVLFFTACGPQNDKKTNTDNSYASHFALSKECAQCHDAIKDGNNADVSITPDWAASMMGNAGRDPLWMAKMRSEIHRFSAVDANGTLRSTVEDKCTKCHMPMANYADKVTGKTPKVFDDGYLSTAHPNHAYAKEGVSCTVCHQIEDNNLGTPEKTSGNYTINANRNIYGQYGSVYKDPMRNFVNYTPTYGKHLDRNDIHSSKMCASCHDLKTPFFDGAGVEQNGTFPEQMAYSEWAHSDYNTTHSCAKCHMPYQHNGVMLSTRPGDLTKTPKKDNFSAHLFVGANSYMLDILKTNAATLGTTGTATGFTRMIEATRTLLKASAELNITAKNYANNELNITLEIQNLGGHKLPTSIPSRRAVVHLLVLDDTNTTVFESGKIEQNGSIAGNNADANASDYEPHYETITASNQVQIYEAVMQNSDDAITYTLLRAATYKKDNRLLPKGFDKTTASSDIKPYGAAATDANFLGGSDTLHYRINTSSFTPPFKVHAALKYQAVGYAFVQDLARDNNLSEVSTYLEMHDGASITYETLAEHNTTIE